MHMYTCTSNLARSSFFFFNDPATTEIYTLSLHDALPISRRAGGRPKTCMRTRCPIPTPARTSRCWRASGERSFSRSEEHTSELQSRRDLVCRLLLEKKKNHKTLSILHFSLYANKSHSIDF